MRMVWGHRVSEAEDLRPLADCLQTHLHVEPEEMYTGYGVVYITGCAGKCGWFQHDNDSVFGCFGKKEAYLIKWAHSSFCGIFTSRLKALKSVLDYYSPPLSTPTFLATFNVSCWSQLSCFPHWSKLSLNAIRPVRLVSLLAADRMPDSLLRLEQNNAGKDILSFSWSPRVPKKRGCSEKWVLGLPLVPLHLTHPLTPARRCAKLELPIFPLSHSPSLSLASSLSFTPEVTGERNKRRCQLTTPLQSDKFWWKCLAAAKIRFSWREGGREGGREGEREGER